MRPLDPAVWLKSVLTTGLLIVAMHGSALDAATPAGVFCAKPAGLVERDVTFDETMKGRDLAARLAGPNKTFLYMKRTSRLAQNRAAMAPIGYASVKAGDKPFGASTPDADHLTSRQYVQIEELAERRIETAALLKQIEAKYAKAPPDPNWYFYSNSPHFGDYLRQKRNLEVADADQGVLLLLNAEGEKQLLARVSQEIVAGLGADIVVIEGEGGDDIDTAHMKTHPAVLRLRDEAASEPSERATEVNRLLQNASTAKTTFLFLMPETAEEAKPWGFSPDMADAYAVNGGRILQDLDRYGLTANIRKIKDRDSLSTAVRGASNDHLFVLIGESGDGENVRLPGSKEVITANDFGSIQAGVSFVGLVCNSQVLLKDFPSLSVVGTIYTDALRSVTQILFDKRESDSLTEYIHAPNDSKGSSVRDALYTSASHLSPSEASVISLRPTLFRVQPLAGAVGLFSSPPIQKPQPSGTDYKHEPIPPTPDTPMLWIALSGVVGGLGRELMRWKTLSDRKRADLFRKPQYFVISAIQLGLAACAALIFTQVVGGHWKYPIAFVSGAGLEELVRLAMKLKIWTPAVAHGPGEREDSIVEFLRA